MNKKLDFAEAMEFLRDRTRFGCNLGLQRIEGLLRKLDNPHQKQVKYIHIGGTNGKGSTLAYLSKILQYAGYKVGTFISPHLHSYTERMQINGENISEEKVAELITDIKPLLEELEAEGSEPPTEFEVNTAMALLYFTREHVDYAILEVGLGGAIDSTNVIYPEVSVITNVAMDHMDYLGKTIEEIAAVKAGIIKSGRPVITGSRDKRVLSVISEKAAAEQSEMLVLDRDFHWENRKAQPDIQSADFIRNDLKLNFSTRMLGKHQLDNAALAIMAAKLLGVYNNELIAHAVHDTVWQGRLEIMSKAPLVVIDGAHNVAGMTALADAINEYWQDYEIVAVIGMLADKERAEALATLLPKVSRAVVTKVPNMRAGNWEYLAEICGEHGVPTECREFVDDACMTGLAAVNDIAAPRKMLLVTGSLYMIADARAFLMERLQSGN